MTCSKCHHLVEEHFNDRQQPVACNNHYVVVNGERYDSGIKCGCMEAVKLFDEPTFPVDVQLSDSTLQRMKKALYE